MSAVAKHRTPLARSRRRLQAGPPTSPFNLDYVPVGAVPARLGREDHPNPSTAGWALMAYMTVIGYCVAYFSWFAALERLPASVATIGTMSVPVIGVVASALALHEPLGLGQIAALGFTLAGVALATRS